MKKNLIAIGILLILGILGFWVYMLLFGGTQDETGTLPRFGADTPNLDRSNTSSIVDTSPVDFNDTPQRLRQLTTRPVIGAVFNEGGIRYTEQGTGHIYDITFSSGNESLVSGTTITPATDALFDQSGEQVLITSLGTNKESVVTLGSIDGTGILQGINLPIGAREAAFNSEGTQVFFLQDSPGGSDGFTYTIESDERQRQFSIPLRDIEVLWGDEVYIYTTPTITQRGHIYSINGNSLTYVVNGDLGLTASLQNEKLLVTSGKGEDRISSAYIEGNEHELPIQIFEEKCTSSFGATTTVFCAASLENNIPDDWYKGIVSFQDLLWELDTENSTAILYSDLLEESGREIDVLKIGTNEEGTLIWFINKNDSTLWMFDTTL